MSAQPSKSMMRNAYEAYLANNFVLVPIAQGSKGPRTMGWNERSHCIFVPEQLPPDNMGVGIAHCYSNTAALDIDDLPEAVAMLGCVGIDLQALLNAEDAVQISSGRVGRAKLLYRLPFGPMRGKQLKVGGKAVLDLRCATANGRTQQDVLPSALLHPTTGQPYVWAGSGHWSKLPLLPPSLLSFWQAQLDVDGTQTIKHTSSTVVNWEEVTSALMSIDPDIHRDEWLHIGMALKDIDPEAGLDLWNEWSKEGSKYQGEKDILTRWKSFKARDNGVTVATIFDLAKKAGWTRPAPDVAPRFSAIVTMTPEQMLDGMAVSPPTLDLANLPQVVAQRAAEVGKIIGGDPMVAVFAGLGAVCGAVNAKTRLEVTDGFKVPPILWSAIIAPPSAKKSPVAKAMLEPLYQIEQDDHARFKLELDKWEIIEAQIAGQRKAVLQDAAALPSLSQIGDLNQMPLVVPPQPVPKRLVIHDVTSQKLANLCSDRPEGLMSYLDEMRGFFKNISSETNTENRSTWISAYEGGYHSMDRVGTGTTTVENFAVSMVGCCQTEVFKKFIVSNATDGLIQRFIPVFLNGMASEISQPMPEYLTNRVEYEHLLYKIHAAPATNYTLSEGAYQAFREFQQWLHTTKNREYRLRSPATFQTALGKMEGVCARIALVFHIVDATGEPAVPAATMQQAIAFVRQYVVPAFRFAYGDFVGVTEDSLEFWLQQYVIQHADQETISMTEIRRSGRRKMEDIPANQVHQVVVEAMVGLEVMGWTALDKEAEKNRTTRWFINPSIAQSFKEYREVLIELKRQQLEDLGDIMRERKAARGA